MSLILAGTIKKKWLKTLEIVLSFVKSQPWTVAVCFQDIDTL